MEHAGSSGSHRQEVLNHFALRLRSRQRQGGFYPGDLGNGHLRQAPAMPRFRSDTPGPRGCWRGSGWHQGKGAEVLKSTSRRRKGVTIPGSREGVLERGRTQTFSVNALYLCLAATWHLVLLGERVFPCNSSSHRSRRVAPLLFPSSPACISLLFAWT